MGVERHPAVTSLLEFFTWEHLPPHLQEVSRPAAQLAYQMANAMPDSPELTVGLRKLLEAKDAFVRARIQQDRAGGGS